jgi:hypothetical protein
VDGAVGLTSGGISGALLPWLPNSPEKDLSPLI